MENNIYVNTLLKKRIIMKPEYINKNFNKNIEKILHNNIADKCINEGYVKGDSINIIKRSLPKVITSNFTGNLAIDIVCSVDICKPVYGNIIQCTINKINILGLQAEVAPLSIIIAKEYHTNKDLFKDLKVGQKIDVMVIATRYTINESKIEVVGKLAGDVDKKPIKLKKLIVKERKNKKELPNIIVEKEEEEEEEEQPVSELEDIAEGEEESQVFEEEEEDVSQMEEDIEANEDEDDEDDMLERSIDEEETEEEDVESYGD